jgi:hypothetical protein
MTFVVVGSARNIISSVVEQVTYMPDSRGSIPDIDK